MKHTRTLLAAMVAATALTGCNTLDRLATVGSEPPMTTIQNPVQAPTYRPVSLPMPVRPPARYQPNSLWRTGSRAFFKDQRAGQVGDILTVMITIDDKAEISNRSTRSRANTEDNALTRLFGYEASLNQLLPEAISPGNLVDIEAATSNRGEGAVDREEEINFQLAAVVTQQLPNGNLVIHGRQEVRVNFEVRELQVAGIIRSEDVSSDNTIPYEKIAEARISYGGRGQISDFQQPRYGQQILDILLPF